MKFKVLMFVFLSTFSIGHFTAARSQSNIDVRFLGLWNYDSNSENIEIRPDATILDFRSGFGQGRIAATLDSGANILLEHQGGRRCYYYVTVMDSDRLRFALRAGNIDFCPTGTLTRVKSTEENNAAAKSQTAGAFFRYTGPSLASTVSELSSKYPPAAWRVDVDGRRYFSMDVGLLGRTIGIFFYTNQSGSHVQSVMFYSSAQYYTRNSHTGNYRMDGSAENVNDLCGEYSRKLVAEIISKSGPMKNAPSIIRRNEDEHAKGFCGRVSTAVGCEYSGNSVVRRFEFVSPLEISLESKQKSRRHKSFGTGSTNGNEWRTEEAEHCSLILKIDKPENFKQ